MQFWLATTNLNTIEKAVKMGIVSGIGTNPTLLAASHLVTEDLLEKLLNIQPGPVAVQVTAPQAEKMIEQGRAIYEFSPRMIVKIPVTAEGLLAIRALTKSEIPVIATEIVDPSQFILAVQAGAHFLAPHYSKMCDEEANGISSMKLMLHFLHHYGFKAKILASSIRSKEQIIQCVSLGVDAVTIDEKVLEEWIEDHPKTKETLSRFNHDWKLAKPRSSLPL